MMTENNDRINQLPDNLETLLRRQEIFSTPDLRI
jgi:hypothetical protein